MIGVEQFRHRNKIGRFTGVDQSEVISILGMSEACEAEWLAAGHLPWRAGQGDQISTVELVDLQLTYLLNLEGWPPEESRSVVGKAIAAVFYNAFLYANHALEVTGSQAAVERFASNFGRSTDLANELTGGPHHFSCIRRVADSDRFRLSKHEQAGQGQADALADAHVCLGSVATDVASRLGRPLLSVELVDHGSTNDDTARWLSSARAD